MKTQTWTGSRLRQDRLLRIGTLGGIHQALPALFDEPAAWRWPTNPNTNPRYAGRSPVRTMIEDGLTAMLGVRRHVESQARNR